MHDETTLIHIHSSLLLVSFSASPQQLFLPAWDQSVHSSLNPFMHVDWRVVAPSVDELQCGEPPKQTHRRWGVSSKRGQDGLQLIFALSSSLSWVGLLGEDYSRCVLTLKSLLHRDVLSGTVGISFPRSRHRALLIPHLGITFLLLHSLKLIKKTKMKKSKIMLKTTSENLFSLFLSVWRTKRGFCFVSLKRLFSFFSVWRD